MRTARRVLTVSALCLPIVLGGATIASADTPDNIPSLNYDHGAFSVGPNGSALHITDVQFGPDGASFLDAAVAVGPNGVAGYATETGISLAG
ncbi:hypothetical protein [Kitasatospora sp. NBC_01300]|uniref:hypothetical protein n=1 Tax=Kitasatospora sp. NBC_01300 TaxID=2903574 RepID=UPI00352ED2BB|nr:hypothetical protein OG556_00080 [Kitasatospora sp. NBC_01300]WSK08413.1 hypothetical protein OG556_33640 [Kitasatospora sp. NBC_01300]